MDTETPPLSASLPTRDNILFSVKVEKEDRCRNITDFQKKPLTEDQINVHPKFEFITAQLPLHSISEDVNSPYFASSPSNITAYVRRQSTPNKEDDTSKNYDRKSSPLTEVNDGNSENKHGGNTGQTTTSLSDLTGTLGDLAQDGEIMKRRLKRIEIFENYLEEWEKQKFEHSQKHMVKAKPKPKAKPRPKAKPSPTPRKVKKSPMKKTYTTAIKPARTPVTARGGNKKTSASLYLGKFNSGSNLKNLASLSPVLQKSSAANRYRK